jgi:hypothetical protein
VSLRFTTSLDYGTYLAANWLMVRRRMLWRGLLRMFLSLWLIYSVLMAAFTSLDDGLDITVILGAAAMGLAFAAAMLVIFAVCWCWTLPRSARKTWPQLHLDGLPTLHEFDEAGIRISNARGSSNFEWFMLTCWVEDEALLMMFRTKLMFHVVPKEQVAPEILQALRARLMEAGVSTRC